EPRHRRGPGQRARPRGQPLRRPEDHRVKITDLTLAELSARLAAREVSAEETARACLERIDATNGTLNAFIHVDGEGALAQAKASDARRAKGEARGPLDGVPLALKDIFCTKGVR